MIRRNTLKTFRNVRYCTVAQTVPMMALAGTWAKVCAEVCMFQPTSGCYIHTSYGEKQEQNRLCTDPVEDHIGGSSSYVLLRQC